MALVGLVVAMVGGCVIRDRPPYEDLVLLKGTRAPTTEQIERYGLHGDERVIAELRVMRSNVVQDLTGIIGFPYRPYEIHSHCSADDDVVLQEEWFDGDKVGENTGDALECNAVEPSDFETPPEPGHPVYLQVLPNRIAPGWGVLIVEKR